MRSESFAFFLFIFFIFLKILNNVVCIWFKSFKFKNINMSELIATKAEK